MPILYFFFMTYKNSYAVQQCLRNTATDGYTILFSYIQLVWFVGWDMIIFITRRLNRPGSPFKMEFGPLQYVRRDSNPASFSHLPFSKPLTKQLGQIVCWNIHSWQICFWSVWYFFFQKFNKDLNKNMTKKNFLFNIYLMWLYPMFKLSQKTIYYLFIITS